MSAIEPHRPEEIVEGHPDDPGDNTTAAAKIMQTLRDMSVPDEDAGELELMLSTVAMGLERGLGEDLAKNQPTGELDKFIASLTRWMAAHRSDSAWRLLVIEVPRKQDLPPATRLKLWDNAEELAQQASSPP